MSVRMQPQCDHDTDDDNAPNLYRDFPLSSPGQNYHQVTDAHIETTLHTLESILADFCLLNSAHRRPKPCLQIILHLNIYCYIN